MMRRMACIRMILCLWAVSASLAYAQDGENPQPWLGIHPTEVYCFHDQAGNFYGLQAEATTTSKSARIWGHVHDTSYPHEDVRFTQQLTGTAYYLSDVDRWNLGLTLTCVADGCESADIHLMCDYTEEPWLCDGQAETRSGVRLPVRLTGIGMNWEAAGRQDCTDAHP